MLVKKLVGEKCYLSPYDVEYAEFFYAWLNDLDVTRNLLLYNKAISLSSEKEIMARLHKDHNYLIVDKDGDKVIGGIGFADIDLANRAAEVGLLIGDKAYWNKGYGTDALKTILDYGFNYLNLNNVLLHVYPFNEGAIRCYEKVGFKKIGARRQALIQNQKTFDVIIMDIIASEFKR